MHPVDAPTISSKILINEPMGSIFQRCKANAIYGQIAKQYV